jgi:predicted deacylase
VSDSILSKVVEPAEKCRCGAVAFDHVHVGMSNEEAELAARDKPRIITRVMDDTIKTRDGLS